MQARAARPAIIPLAVGERAWIDSARFTTLKVDPVTVGSSHFALGQEDLLPGSAIPLHRHATDEEILIVHRGHARVRLGDSTYAVEAGGIAYAPPRTWIRVANDGSDTLTIFYIFPTPHFLEYMRSITSATPGGRPLSAAERARLDSLHGIEFRRQ
jgi:quercetin dioxygenase-like cupin family protein